VFAELSGGGRLSRWLAYADDFRRLRLPWLLGVWAAAALNYLALAIEGRWRPLTRWAGVAFNVASAGVLTWFIAGGDMFQNDRVDAVAKAGVASAIAIVVIDVGFKLYRVRGRARTPKDASPI
jgi:hypothetical protein